MEDINRVLYEIRSLNNKIESLRLGMRNMTVQPRLQYFILHICDHCNLNCAGCNHLSNLAEPRFIDKEILLKDMTRMYDVHGDIPSIGIMGGEPLLHPEIKEILKGARSVFNHSRLLLSTNGILCRKVDDEFWDICRGLNIIIRFTRYPINVDYDEMETEIRNRGIEVTYFGDDRENISDFQSIALDLDGNCDPIRSFSGCIFANRCAVVVDGKLYPCPIVQNSYLLDDRFGYHLGVDDRDYIDIYKSDEMDALHFLSRPIPFCRYCDVNKREELSFIWRTTGKGPYEWCDFSFSERSIKYLQGKSLYVYGAGTWGRKTVARLRKCGILPVSVLVSEMYSNPSDIEGIPVKGVDTVEFENNAVCIIAVYSKQSRVDMQKKIIEKGIRNIAILIQEPR